MVTSQFFAYNNGYLPTTTIGSGEACWVKVNQDGSLTLTASGRTAAGNIRIVPTNELPPPPPGGDREFRVPAQYGLSQNYPNPFNPSTVIRYSLSADSRVTLTVYDLLGREVARLVDGMQQAGFREARWDASTTPSGVYYYTIVAGGFSRTNKMILVR